MERLPHTKSLSMGHMQQNGEDMELDTPQPTEDQPVQSHSRTHTLAGSGDMDNEYPNAEETGRMLHKLAPKSPEHVLEKPPHPC